MKEKVQIQARVKAHEGDKHYPFVQPAYHGKTTPRPPSATEGGSSTNVSKV